MHFTVPKEPLVKALTRAAAIASSKSTLPVLSYARIEPMPRVLSISATDLDVGYTTGILLDWPEPNPNGQVATLLPAKPLLECVKAIPVSDVAIGITDHIATISGGTVSFTLTGLDTEEYPEIPVNSMEAGAIGISHEALSAVLDSVRYCQCKDDTRHNLCGSWLKLEHNSEGELFALAVSTDGHRLCVATDSITPPNSDDLVFAADQTIPAELAKGVIVPAKGIDAILRMAGSGPALLAVAANSLALSLGDSALCIRLVDGDYPDWNRVVPASPTATIVAKREALADAIERVRIMTSKESKGVGLTLEGDILNLNAALSEKGAEASDHVTVEPTDAIEPMRFNADYLLQSLDNIDGAQVEIRITNGTSPIIINPAGSDYPQAVVMPMRAN